MRRAWGIVRDTDDIHVAVLRANGDRAFCTDIDIKGGMWWGDVNIWNQTDPGEFLGPVRTRCGSRSCAPCRGCARQAVSTWSNECDIVIASDSATFFDPHANGGIVSALEPIGMLHRGVPLGEVLRWALMGTEERITADTALRIGLVTEVVSDDDLRTRAADIAAQIADRNPISHPGHGPCDLGGDRDDAAPGEAERPRLHPHRQQARRRAPWRSRVNRPPTLR